MTIVNVEFKARTPSLSAAEQKLLLFSPKFMGEDNQTDTYFNVSLGRLKLREGNIENALIHYQRENSANAKQSDVILYRCSPDKALKQILTKSLGVKVVVNKKRKIYFIDNVKFHFDIVTGLGSFIEVEAIDTAGERGTEELRKQCDKYAAILDIGPADYISESYSDMLIHKATHSRHSSESSMIPQKKLSGGNESQLL
jgi:adenylate cyclase, class 2